MFVIVVTFSVVEVFDATSNVVIDVRLSVEVEVFVV